MGKFVIYKTATGYNFSLYAANQVKLALEMIKRYDEMDNIVRKYQ